MVGIKKEERNHKMNADKKRILKYTKVLIAVALILIIIYLLSPMIPFHDPIMPFIIQNDILGSKEIFGCEMSPCCPDGFNKSSVPDPNYNPEKLCSVVFTSRSFICILGLLLFIISIFLFLYMRVMTKRKPEN